MIIEHPEKPQKRKLTQNQIDFLRRVVATNGGGVYISSRDIATARSLVNRHLIQGKAGSEWRAVHTREGLEYIRALDKEAMR